MQDELEENRERLKALCRNLGADERKAPVLAGQLIKRARQMARQRQCKPVEAMDHLLRVMISGRQGVVHRDPPPGKDSDGSAGGKKESCSGNSD